MIVDNLHNDCPLAHEKIKIKQDMISNYCHEITDEHNIKVGSVIKLVSNLDNKTKCVLIIYAVRNEINKHSWSIDIQAIAMVKPYIDFNTDKKIE